MRALDLILTGRRGDVEETPSTGLVNRIIPAVRARRVAERWKREIAASHKTVSGKTEKPSS
jgi:enoyl-CoA hydratase/carnithine racemase